VISVGLMHCVSAFVLACGYWPAPEDLQSEPVCDFVVLCEQGDQVVVDGRVLSKRRPSLPYEKIVVVAGVTMSAKGKVLYRKQIYNAHSMVGDWGPVISKATMQANGHLLPEIERKLWPTLNTCTIKGHVFASDAAVVYGDQRRSRRADKLALFLEAQAAVMDAFPKKELQPATVQSVVDPVWGKK